MGRRSEERTGAVLAMFSAAARRPGTAGVAELGVALAERHQARHEEHEQQDDQLEGEELPRQGDARTVPTGTAATGGTTSSTTSFGCLMVT